MRVRYAEALLAHGAHDEARDVIARARDILETRARQIADLALRARYLATVPAHARVLELASELG